MNQILKQFFYYILLINRLTIIISYNDEPMLVFPFKIIGLASLNNLEEEKNSEIYDSLKFFNTLFI